MIVEDGYEPPVPIFRVGDRVLAQSDEMPFPVPCRILSIIVSKPYDVGNGNIIAAFIYYMVANDIGTVYRFSQKVLTLDVVRQRSEKLERYFESDGE
jgi:hypothetical protein